MLALLLALPFIVNLTVLALLGELIEGDSTLAFRLPYWPLWVFTVAVSVLEAAILASY